MRTVHRHRYGEIDITMNILEEMMKKVPNMKVIVNGDDELSAYLAMDCSNPFVTYGISKPVIKNKTNEIREGRFCKCCGERLVYSFYHYSQLGDYRCPKCGFKRPEINFDSTGYKRIATVHGKICGQCIVTVMVRLISP